MILYPFDYTYAKLIKYTVLFTFYLAWYMNIFYNLLINSYNFIVIMLAIACNITIKKNNFTTENYNKKKYLKSIYSCANC